MVIGIGISGDTSPDMMGRVSVTLLRRLLCPLGLAAVVMCTLSGCFTLRMDLQLRADDTVDGSVALAFDEQVAEQAGGEKALIDALVDGKTPLFDEPPSGGGVEVKEYRQDERVGVEYVLSAVPISDFSTAVGSREGAIREFAIQRVGDTFVVDGKVNVQAFLGAANSVSTVEALDAADLSISLTFPGMVIESNGTVNGNTVTWTPPVDSAFVIHAVGDAGNGSRSGLLVGVVVGLCLLAVLIPLAVIASRRWSRRGVSRE